LRFCNSQKQEMVQPFCAMNKEEQNVQHKELSLCAINKFYFCLLHINLIHCVAHFVLFIHCTAGLHHFLLLDVAQTQKFFMALRHVAPVFALI